MNSEEALSQFNITPKPIVLLTAEEALAQFKNKPCITECKPLDLTTSLPRETSIEAFRQVQHNLGEKQQVVLIAISQLGKCSNSEIAKHLGVSINNVTPRCLELRVKGIVIESGKRQCSVTGKNVLVWKLRNKNMLPPFIR